MLPDMSKLLKMYPTHLYFCWLCYVLNGTSRGNPAINGETLKEELDDQYFKSSDWVVMDPVPFENTRLYGGQQFERVFAEFRAIVSKLKVDDRDVNALPDAEDKKYLWTVRNQFTINNQWNLNLKENDELVINCRHFI